MKKLRLLWIRFWGKKYYIIYTDVLKENEIIVFKHKIYVGKGRD